MPNELDQDAVNLSKAIRYTESRDNENAKGASGEFGLYQFMPDTWERTTKKYNLDTNDKSRQNQNKAAYLQIKELKDQGYKPSQIAAFWNSGKTEGWENNIGTNDFGVKYDTPGYVKKVGEAYNQVKGGQQMSPQMTASTALPQIPGVPPPPSFKSPEMPEAPLPTEEKSFLGKAVDFMGFGKTLDTMHKLAGKMQSGQEIEDVSAKDVIGAGLNIGSLFVGGGGLKKAIGTGFKAGVLPLIKQGVATGFKSAGLAGLGQGLEEDKSVVGAAGQGLVYGAGGALTGGILGAGTPMAGKILSGTASKVKGVYNSVMDTEKYVNDAIQKDVQEILGNGRVMTNATQKMAERNIPISEMLSDPDIFRGIQVSDNKIVADEAIATVDQRIEDYLKAKRDILPELDRITTPISREAVREEAKNAVRGMMSPADENFLLRSIDRQVDALPESISLSKLDDLRAQFRKSARNARGLQKSDSEYSALENATRDILFKQTDNLPFDTNKEFPMLNEEIKRLIGTKEFLEKTLQGRNAPHAGWGRQALGNIVGGMAGGAFHGPLGTLLGSYAGGRIASVIMNGRLGTSLKMKLIKGMTKDKKVIKAAEEFLKKAKNYDPLKERLALPAPAIQLPGPKKLEVKAVPAPKGEPGRTPKGQPKGGRFFKTFKSTPPGNMAAAPIGALGGAEKDEQGNTTIDPGKAALGMGVAGLLSRRNIPASAGLNQAFKDAMFRRNELIKQGFKESHPRIKQLDKALDAIIDLRVNMGNKAKKKRRP